MVPAPDLVDREFEASDPDRLWIADMGIYVLTTTCLVQSGPSPAFGKRGGGEAEVRPSMGSLRDTYGNALSPNASSRRSSVSSLIGFRSDGRRLRLHRSLVQPAPAMLGHRLRVLPSTTEEAAWQ